MADDLLLENGDRLLLEDGSGVLLLEQQEAGFVMAAFPEMDVPPRCAPVPIPYE